MTQPNDAPLAGLRVLDFTGTVSGSFGAMILADLGADLVKVERPGSGDDARQMMPQVEGWSTPFIALNRNKRSIAIDLKMTAGLEVAMEIAKSSDVVIENMRPGKMKALGLGFDAVSAVNPGIVYCSVSGFGQTGPLSRRPTYDAIIQARTGIMSITGEQERPPVRVGPSIIDLATGMWAATAVLSALWRRDKLGKPQHLDVSMFDTGMTWMMLPLVQLSLSGVMPQRMGGQTPISVPADNYPTADGYMVVAILNDGIWHRFCQLAQFAELRGNDQFATNQARVLNREALTDILRREFAKKTTADWLVELRKIEVPCEPVNDVAAALNDEQAAERDIWLKSSFGPFKDRISGVGLPIRNSGYESPRPSQDPPRLGQHTLQLLHELGYSDQRIDDLRATGAVSVDPNVPITGTVPSITAGAD